MTSFAWLSMLRVGSTSEASMPDALEGLVRLALHTGGDREGQDMDRKIPTPEELEQVHEDAVEAGTLCPIHRVTHR